ncbi:MAG: YicC family protein [Gammaproteobacteria bacterium]|nr:YicC family protein [Gammaproteobacteria bacterium]
MIRSMTGFARTETATPQGQLLWEIRSVNHRHLEVLLKVPDFCRGVEADLRQLATARLGRGRVEASLSLRAGEARSPAGKLNLPLVRQLAAHLDAISDELGTASPVTPVDILRWPGVLEQDEQDHAALLPAVTGNFEAALAELQAARAREGARIDEMLQRRLTEIEAHVADVVARLPAVLARIRERMAERVAALATPVDPERLEQEIVLLAQKLDVSEELDRLRAHLAEFRDNLQSDAPVGRRLDFLVQELNREANTLASKSADAETTRRAVDIKVLIEQIREQVQNVE